MTNAFSKTISKALLVVLISGTALAAETGALQTDTFQAIEEYQSMDDPSYVKDSAHPITGQHLESEMEKAFEIHPSHPINDALERHNNTAHDSAHGDAHANEAHTDAHGGDHSGGGLPQLDPTWFPSQLFWLFVTFGFLYVFFSRTVLPSLAGTIEKRRTQVDGDLQNAEDMKEEAERVHNAYEEALDEARVKAHKILSDNETRLKEKAAERLKAIREKTAKSIEHTESEIAKAKEAALQDIEQIVADVSSEAAEKIVGIAADKKKVASVVKNINREAA